jgi:hypothetical protein
MHVVQNVTFDLPQHVLNLVNPHTGLVVQQAL